MPHGLDGQDNHPKDQFSGFFGTGLWSGQRECCTRRGARSNNPNFTKPDPALVDLQAAAGSLNQAMTMAPGQARDEAVAAQRRAVEQMLEDLVDNLEKTALNDPVKLATTGFDLKKTTSQTGEAPPIPQNVRLRLTGTSAGTPRFHQ